VVILFGLGRSSPATFLRQFPDVALFLTMHSTRRRVGQPRVDPRPLLSLAWAYRTSSMHYVVTAAFLLAVVAGSIAAVIVRIIASAL